jgi:hypothetical protein
MRVVADKLQTSNIVLNKQLPTSICLRTKTALLVNYFKYFLYSPKSVKSSAASTNRAEQVF